MEVESKILDNSDITIVSVNGRIDSYTNSIFENEIITNIDIGQIKVVVDFTEVSYISSQGLRTVVTALKKSKGQGGFLKLAGLNESVKKIFSVAGLDKVIPIFDSVDAAIV